jgi:peroxiredoxin
MRSSTAQSLKFWITTLSLILIGGLAHGEQAVSFSLQDTEGREHKLADYRGKIVVLEFTNYHCPFVKKHYQKSANLPDLQKTYRSKGVVWLSICSSAPGKQGYMDSSAIKKEQALNGAAPSAYLIDADGRVGKALKAKVTPHLFVIGPKGDVVYGGGIDSIKSTKASDIAKAVPHLKHALDELLAGNPVSVKTSKAYGCSIKYAR